MKNQSPLHPVHRNKFLACFLSGIALAFAALLVPAHAQEAASPDAGRVTIKLSQARVVTENGKEKLEDASVVKPGDVIEYRAIYTNTGTTPVTSLVATLPVADGLEYLPNTAQPKTPAPRAATKDGQYAAMPLMRTVPGKSRPEPVPYAEYRSLRWNVAQLPANGVFVVSARVQVADGAPQPAAPLSR
jgi:uncharacterized repeat protein (TIGR01451 family)